MTRKTIAVIGGGAAGFFSAINAALSEPGAKVTLYEKTDKLLAKVRVSGGGRCNVTNACVSISELVKKYPRGGRALKQLFQVFSTNDTVKWFEQRGVKLKAEQDGRMFPATDNSQTIIDCLMSEAAACAVDIKRSHAINSLKKQGDKWVLNDSIHADSVIITTGGHNKPEGYKWLTDLGFKVKAPVPSLFTFNLPKHPITALMGVAQKNVRVKLSGTKYVEEGPLLITHWGMSGPAILKTSAFAADYLHEKNYEFKFTVNWLYNLTHEDVSSLLFDIRKESPKLHVGNLYERLDIVKRLYQFMLQQLEIDGSKPMSDLTSKEMNRLCNIMVSHEFDARGKTTFKEEFVTAGGVELDQLDLKTMECKNLPGLYFAGEVLNIDGITGGFNFQAAWTTGFIAGKSSIR